MTQRIKFSGGGVRPCALQVPGWGGGESNSPQPWHAAEFAEFANSGAEIVYAGADADVSPGNVPPPFLELSEHFYSWDSGQTIRVAPNHDILVLPHYRFYTGEDAPLIMPGLYQCDWWPKPIVLRFRNRGKSAFRTGEPCAQVVVVPRESYSAEKLSEKEVEALALSAKAAEEARGFVTREWITTSGAKQDNLYEVLRHLHKQRRLPPEIHQTARRLRIIPSNELDESEKAGRPQFRNDRPENRGGNSDAAQGSEEVREEVDTTQEKR